MQKAEQGMHVTYPICKEYTLGFSMKLGVVEKPNTSLPEAVSIANLLLGFIKIYGTSLDHRQFSIIYRIDWRQYSDAKYHIKIIGRSEMRLIRTIGSPGKQEMS